MCSRKNYVEFPVALKFLKGVAQFFGKSRGVLSGISKGKVKNKKFSGISVNVIRTL